MATRTRKPGTRLMTGVAELDKKLEGLKLGAANKIARPALSKAARFLLKKVKAGVPPQYKDAKRALGMVVDAKGGKSRNQQRAKVGASVGKASKAVAKGDRTKPGVGIGGNNLHWFILGADGRSQGGSSRIQKTTKKSTGVMKPVMPGLVKDASSAAQSEMLNIIRSEVTTRLAALAAKGG